MCRLAERLAFPLLGLTLAACSALVKPPATLPQGVSCGKIYVSGADLAAELQGRTGGECVLLGTGIYSGNFVLPVDVSLLGGEGSTVVLRGLAPGQPALTVKGGPRTQLRGLRIDASAGGGIAIDPGPATMSGVTITGTSAAGLTATCTQPDCDQREVVVDDCQLTSNRVGLLVRGAQVRLTAGRIADTRAVGLGEGSGVVALDGAVVTLTQVTVEDNAYVGVFLDGAATRATLDGVTVRANLGRGVWAQGLRGTATLTVTGGTVTRNNLVGLGALDCEGLVVSGTTVSETQLTPRSPDLSRIEYVGDGVGLFGGTRASSLSGLVLVDNGRAQLLVDSGGDGLTVSGAASGGQYRAVVQRTAAAVEVPAALLDSPPQLYVDDASLPAP